MSAADLRGHRLPYVRAELEKLRGFAILITPKDPDPYPNFYINGVGEAEVGFSKRSNGDLVTVDLRKITEITPPAENTAHIRVLGRVVWHADIKRWRFAPTGSVGRTPLERVS